MTEEKQLNPEQLEAVQHGSGPLLIIAGAGTGKTTVITERVKWLISQSLAKPSEILALTFTEKAAREMEERVDLIMPYGYTQMWISTFHSFCDRILRLETLHIGLNPKYTLLTQAETIMFLRRHLFRFDLKYFRPLGNPNKFLEGIISHFQRLKDEDVSPGEYLNWAEIQKEKPESDKEETEKFQELAKAYKNYEELKIKEGLVDFGDLISNTLKLFRLRKNILKEYRNQFKYVLVDEFQDTNYAQYQLIKLLAPPKQKPNLTVVGDDSQSIYKFRGAAVSNILQFMSEYKQAKQVILNKNYRSTQTVLDCAYRLIKHNDPDTLEAKLGISKNLKKTRKAEETPVEFLYLEREENEAEEAGEKIINLCSDFPSFRYSDFAILVRANSHADSFVRVFNRLGIPYQFLGPGMLFRQPEVKDLIAYLKVLDNYQDSVSFFRVLSIECFAVNNRDLVALNNFARQVNLSLFEAGEIISGEGEYEKYQKFQPFISEKTKETIKKITKMIHRHFKLLIKETAGQILYYFLEESGLLRKLASFQTPLEEKRALNISKFFERLKTYEIEHEDATVKTVVDWIDVSLEYGESPLSAETDRTENNAVNILTVHSAKGLEFPVVFLVNLVVQRFPTNERREQIPIPDELIKETLPIGDYHLEEERRLFYVGMTRAKDRLFLTAAKYYKEGRRERKISPFVFEALGKKLEEAMVKKTEQLNIFGWRKKEEEPPSVIATGPKPPIAYLSFSQIEVFNTCPLQYKYRYLLKIPVLPSSAGAFGNSIHQTLYHFYKLADARFLQANKKAAEGIKPSRDDLLAIFAENWSPIGYQSKAHEEKRKKEGEKMLSLFYEKAYDSIRPPKSLEQVFKISLTPSFKVGGKIDRIDELDRGILEIIDYKTGKIPDPKKIEESLQMTVYALAASDPGIYNLPAEKIILSFYFLENQEKISTRRTEEDLKEARKKLIAKKEEIEKSSFEPKTGPMCRFCDFKMICEAWQ